MDLLIWETLKWSLGLSCCWVPGPLFPLIPSSSHPTPFDTASHTVALAAHSYGSPIQRPEHMNQSSASLSFSLPTSVGISLLTVLCSLEPIALSLLRLSNLSRDGIGALWTLY